MDKRILLPVDDSDQTHRAAELAFELFSDARLVLIHVINPAEAGFTTEAAIPNFPENWYEQQESDAEAIFDDIESEAKEYGIEVEGVLELGQPARTIVDHIEAADIDHVVMGSHGRKGVSRILLGSVAETVLRRSTVPVTVVR